MLGVAGLRPPSAPPLFHKRASSFNPILSTLFIGQTDEEHLSLLPGALPNCSPLFLGRTGFCLFAQKKQQGSSFGSIRLMKELDFEEEDEFGIDENDVDLDDEDGEFDEEIDDEDEDDDDVIVPFHEMDAWLKKKPRGFGEGKVYDTSIEDKLLEEIEQGRKAQLANINRLKNEPKEPTFKRELKNEHKASEGVPSGIRVRINNLPKKKNIHRDLKSAFEGVHGIIKISPVVSANKRTRDPVCKGFGFVDFKSMEDANRFVQMFSSQNITFGKIGKHINCEILRPHDAGHEGSAHNGYKITSESRFIISEDEDNRYSDSEQKFCEDDDHDESSEEFDCEDVVDSFGLLSASEQDGSSVTELKMSSTTDSASSTHEHKTKAVKKKSAAKKKPDKIPKLNIPGGSAKRLKVREKAKLADVFSRYGSKEALASKQM